MKCKKRRERVADEKINKSRKKEREKESKQGGKKVGRKQRNKKKDKEKRKTGTTTRRKEEEWQRKQNILQQNYRLSKITTDTDQALKCKTIRQQSTISPESQVM